MTPLKWIPFSAKAQHYTVGYCDNDIHGNVITSGLISLWMMSWEWGIYFICKIPLTTVFLIRSISAVISTITSVCDVNALSIAASELVSQATCRSTSNSEHSHQEQTLNSREKISETSICSYRDILRSIMIPRSYMVIKIRSTVKKS